MLIGGILAPLGLDRGVIYYAVRYRSKDEKRFVSTVRQALGMTVGIAALMGALLFVGSPWIANKVFHQDALVSVFRVIAWGVIFYAALRVAAAATTISCKVEYAVGSQELSQPFVHIFLVLTLYVTGAKEMSVLTVLGAGVLSFGLAFGLALFFLYQLFPNLFLRHTGGEAVYRELFSFSWLVALATMFGVYPVWLNRLQVGMFRSPEETGVYQVASQVALLFPIIQAAFTVVLSPLVAELFAKAEQERLNELYKVGTKWALYVGAPLMLIVMLFPQKVLALLFGSGYAEGGMALRILTLAQMVNVGVGAVEVFLIMGGHQRRWSLISGGALFTNVALGMVLIPKMGLLGGALSMAIPFGGMFVWGLMDARRLLGIWPYDRRFLKGIVAGGVATAAMWGVSRLFSLPLWGEMIAVGVVGVAIFWSTLVWLGLDVEDREFIQMITSRLV